MTPLENILRDMILADGPMPMDRYMALCLGHPRYGYYMTRDPFGQTGDFTTAPEISQVFGELIGVWLVQAWRLMGSPGQFSLCELGPGRGTLMKDIWRATSKVNAFQSAAEICMVETSPVLRQAQAQTLAHVALFGAAKGNETKVTWHDTMSTLPSQPVLFVANEFFDALPIRQFEMIDGELFERCIKLQSETLVMGLIPTGQRNAVSANRIFETSPARAAAARDLATVIVSNGGAALVFDYGHRKTASGETLQAMKNHAYCSILESPGDADLTSHVDFEHLQKTCEQAGALNLPLLTQGEFLNAMGLPMRTDVLARNLDVPAREAFLQASTRLAGNDGMGQLFKVAAITHKDMPPPFPFGSA